MSIRVLVVAASICACRAGSSTGRGPGAGRGLLAGFLHPTVYAGGRIVSRRRERCVQLRAVDGGQGPGPSKQGAKAFTSPLAPLWALRLRTDERKAEKATSSIKPLPPRSSKQSLATTKPPASTTTTKPVSAVASVKATPQPAAFVPEGLTPESIRILVLAFMCMMVCSLDRVAMSVTLLPMSMDFGYSETTKGAISSMFSTGYMTTMLPSGIMATVYSPKALLTMGVAVWSAAQILSPHAAHNSLAALLACRFLMGATESIATPSVQQLVSKWFPEDMRSRVVSLLASGLNLGTLGAYLVTPYVIQATSWEQVFHLYGGLGLLWLLLWVPLAADKPTPPTPTPSLLSTGTSGPYSNRQSTVTDAANVNGAASEEGLLLGVSSALTGVRESLGEAVASLKATPWGEFVRSKELWAVAAAHAAHNYGLYVALAWLPTFFSQTYHLDLKHSSALSVAPWVAAAITTNIAGWGADALINNGILTRTATRKVFQSAALLIPAACMWNIANVPHTSTEAAAIFTLSIAAGSMSCAGFATATQDLANKYIGITYGATSALSVVVGAVGTFYTGVLLDELHNWSLAFELASGVYIVGAVLFAWLYQAKRIFD